MSVSAVGRHRKPARDVTVALVSLPFKDLRHPPIQLGILQSALRDAGISARSHSFELTFMEHLRKTDGGEPFTVSDYQEIAHNAFVVQLGDWIFKVPPYAEASAEDDEEYLAYVRGAGIAERIITNAIRMKAAVPAFLRAAVKELMAEHPRIVGFSTVFQQNVASLALAKLLKSADPAVTIVFGGDNCDGAMGPELHRCFPWVDVVVRGEGERALVGIAEDVLAGRPIRPQPGLCYRDGERAVAVPQDSSPQLPMNEVPAPVYDDFFAHLAHSPLRAELWPDVAILFESSRGCWWGAKQHCTFCGLNDATMMFRSKPAKRVADEILDLARRYKVLKFVAVDDIIDVVHIRELLPLLRDAHCDLEIYYETKANLTKDQLRAFYAAGVDQIQPGIESLSTPILQLMRKGITALQNVRLLKWCAEIGISADWNLLYGFPGEEPEEYARMEALIPSLAHLEPPNFAPVQLQRFSPYFEQARELGLEVVGPMPYYRHLYDVPPDALANIAYDFEHRYLDGRNPASYTRGVHRAVHQWRADGAKSAGSLRYRRGPDFLIVEDRRPSFEPADYQFDGAEARIYLACDGGATAETVRQQLCAAGDDELETAEIEEFLDELTAARLMYREGARFLSLAIASHPETSA